MEISRSPNGRQTNAKENFNIKPNKKRKHGAPTTKMDHFTPQEDGTDQAQPKL